MFVRRSLSIRDVDTHSSNRGFTLLEILVVIVIMGILATAVVVKAVDKPHEARVVKAQADIAAIETGLEMYLMDHASYPESVQVLEPKYMKRVPNDPWKNSYQIAKPGARGEIDIFSFGADGEAGGEGMEADIGNWDLR